jgi:hypothetical protein
MRIEKRVRGILKQFSGEPSLDPPDYHSEYLEDRWEIELQPEVMALLRSDNPDDFWEKAYEVEERIDDNLTSDIGFEIYETKVELQDGLSKNGLPVYYIGITFTHSLNDGELEEAGEGVGRELMKIPEIKGAWLKY